MQAKRPESGPGICSEENSRHRRRHCPNDQRNQRLLDAILGAGFIDALVQDAGDAGPYAVGTAGRSET